MKFCNCYCDWYELKIEKKKREMGNLFEKIGKCESENMCTRRIDWFVIVLHSKNSNLHQNHYIAQFENNVE